MHQRIIMTFFTVIALASCGDANDADTIAEAATPANSHASPANGTAETSADAEYALGTPRDDLQRFYGLYAIPDRPGRNLFVAKADSGNPDRPIPDGYLMIGAMWGDAANWYMKSVGETRFEQQWVNPGMEPVVATFKLGANGEAVAMEFSSRFMNYEEMPRSGELPEGW